MRAVSPEGSSYMQYVCCYFPENINFLHNFTQESHFMSSFHLFVGNKSLRILHSHLSQIASAMD